MLQTTLPIEESHQKRVQHLKTPTLRSTSFQARHDKISYVAAIAQLVERIHGKDEVSGSSPDRGSITFDILIYMAQFSFDIQSSYDKAEMNNVFLQAEKEISSRYDFRGTSASIEWLKDKTGVKVVADNAWQLEQVIDLFRKKLAAREQSSKVLNLESEIRESNMKAWQDIPFKDGLKQDDAKKITKLLKEKHPKAKAQIQGDEVRVSSSSKDELQAVINTLREEDFEFPLQFTNYR